MAPRSTPIEVHAMATIEELDEVDGIGEVRARAINEGLKRIQEQVFIDRHI